MYFWEIIYFLFFQLYFSLFICISDSSRLRVSAKLDLLHTFVILVFLKSQYPRLTLLFDLAVSENPISPPSLPDRLIAPAIFLIKLYSCCICVLSSTLSYKFMSVHLPLRP